MADGLVEQIGTPEAVYSEPASAYVAGFLGSANVVDVQVHGPESGAVACQLGPFRFKAVGDPTPGPAKVVIRPERVLLGANDSATPDGASSFPGLVDHVIYLGPTTHVVVRLSDGQTLLAAVPNAIGPASAWYQPGASVQAHVHPEACRLLPADTRPLPAPDPEEAPVGS